MAKVMYNTIMAESKNNAHKIVTTKHSKKLPMAIAKNECQNFISVKDATAELLQTPASGNGIAVKKAKVINF